MSTRSFLLLGSNQGDAAAYLDKAREAITAQAGAIVTISSLYQTGAWGKTDQPDFLNQVIEILFDGSAVDLLATLLSIEKQLGRVRIEKWGSRIIDIDILFFGDKIIEAKDLQIPHPQLPYRRFTLIPLVEIAPDFIHPVSGKSNRQLLEECTDLLPVKKISVGL